MSELYTAEIRDELGHVTSATLVHTPAEVAQWYMERGIKLDAVEMTMPDREGLIAAYTAKEPDPETDYVMVEGEGAPQYTFLPAQDAQLCLF